MPRDFSLIALCASVLNPAIKLNWHEKYEPTKVEQVKRTGEFLLDLLNVHLLTKGSGSPTISLRHLRNPWVIDSVYPIVTFLDLAPSGSHVIVVPMETNTDPRGNLNMAFEGHQSNQ
jgi:hypothetical protein